jgi:hypothetical protein
MLRNQSAAATEREWKADVLLHPSNLSAVHGKSLVPYTVSLLRIGARCCSLWNRFLPSPNFQLGKRVPGTKQSENRAQIPRTDSMQCARKKYLLSDRFDRKCKIDGSICKMGSRLIREVNTGFCRPQVWGNPFQICSEALGQTFENLHKTGFKETGQHVVLADV